MLKADHHLILALDVVDRRRALKTARDASEYVDAIKVHWPVILCGGLGGIEEIAELAPVIVDAKLSDIPNTNRVACELFAGAGATGVICQGFAGRDSIEACISAGLDVYVLVEMSHPGSLQFISPRSEEIAAMARESSAAGIVAPGNRPERLVAYRGIVGEEMHILCPGIGAQGGKPGDAVANGADFEIVGRSIYDSDDPALAAERISGAIANRLSA